MSNESDLGTNAVPIEPDENLQQVEESEATTEPSEAELEKTAMQKRFDELTREKYEAKREAGRAKQENEHLKSLISSGEPAVTNDDELVTRKAEQLLLDQRFNEACNKIYDLGVAEFPDFGSSVENLQMVGMNRDFLEVISIASNGHNIINHLGSNLDEAERIAGLPPLKMAVELAKLEYELRGKTKKISGAPEPIKPVSGVKGTTKAPDKMTDKEFAAWRREQIKNRN